MLRLAIILCDDLGRRISSTFASYGSLYADFVKLGADDDIEFEFFRAHEGELPAQVNDFDALVIGGSRAGVYEPHEWISPLIDMARTAIDSHVTTTGICFGHQLIASALGAEVRPARGGWNLAAQNYQLSDTALTDGGEQMRLIAFHQDQVQNIPEGTTAYLTSEGCEIAGLITDSIFTMQPHPEFTPEVTSAILSASRGGAISESNIDDALERLDGEFSARRASELFWSAFQRTRAHQAAETSAD